MKALLTKTLLVAVLPLIHAVSASGQTIPQQIDTILARTAVAGNTWTILVQNETGTVTYYQKNPNTGKAPASNTKIFTTSAAFGLLGTNHSFESRVYYTGTFSGGVVSGNLGLVCEHDMTWNEDTLGTGNSRKALDFITTKLKALGLTQVSGNVQIYGACMYDHTSTDITTDTQNQASYNLEGATAFKAALQAQGIAVSGSAQGQTGFTIPTSTLMYTYQSTNLTYGGKPLRLDVACIPLMKVSHNVMADLLLRHIGYKLSSSDTFSAGRNKLLGWMKDTAGISTNGIAMFDGSGLSHSDSFSAQQTISMIRYMLGAFPTWKTTLPIGCTDGTIGGRFCGTDGDGQVHAKTGSLSISIALSGYIDNQYDNCRYLFSFISNDSGGIDQTSTRDAIDDCVVLFGARGVPTSPQILSVTNRANGTLRVTWSDEGFVHTGYRVYASADGITFGAPVDLGAAAQTYTESGLSPGMKRYYRVSVVGSGGESAPSRVYGAQVSNAKSPIVIVDGNDRWQFQTSENPNADNHSFAVITGQSISGPAFDTVNHNVFIDGTMALTNYRAAIWLLGEESTVDESFSSAEQGLVSSYLAANGNLFLSGSEIGWDLDRPSGPTTADRNFYHNQLRTVYANDDAGTYSFTPVANGIFSGNVNATFDNGTHGTYNVDFPDVLTSTNGSVAAITYSGGTGGAAALVYNGTSAGGKIVNFGFPFETIVSPTARDAYMSDILKFFGLLELPTVAMPQLDPAQNQAVLSWNGKAGLKYRLQYKTNLNQLNWIDVVPDITATNTTVTATTSLGTSQKFFRILLVN